MVATAPHSTSVPSADRVALLTRIVAAGFLAGVVLSWSLWLNHDSYPRVPFAVTFPALPSPVDFLVFLAFLTLLAVVVVRPRSTSSLVALLTVALALVVLDQSRWQPWVYQYLVILGIFALARSQPVGARHFAEQATRIALAGIYFWSGFHKLSTSFTQNVFPWFLEPLPTLPPMESLGPLVPFTEMFIAVGLLTPRLRQPAVCVAVTTHLIVLAALLGHGWNSVVWPWNVTMILLVIVTFWNPPARPVSGESFGSRTVPARLVPLVVASLFWVLPALTVFDRFDSYLSFELYSGRTPRGVVYLDEGAKRGLDAQVAPYARMSSSGRYQLSLSRWSMGQLNVPPPPERRIFMGVAEHLCPLASSPSSVVLVIAGRPGRRERHRETASYGCNEVGELQPLDRLQDGILN